MDKKKAPKGQIVKLTGVTTELPIGMLVKQLHRWCKKNNKFIVIGTYGYKVMDNVLNEIKNKQIEYSKLINLFYIP